MPECPEESHLDELLAMLRRVQHGDELYWLDEREACAEDGELFINYGGRFPASRKREPVLISLDRYVCHLDTVFRPGRP